MKQCLSVYIICVVSIQFITVFVHEQQFLAELFSFFPSLFPQKICAQPQDFFLFPSFRTLFRILRMFVMIRGFQQGLVIGNCMQFGWVWGCGCGFCPWHSVSAKLLTVVCGCSDYSGIPSPEVYYALPFDVWSTHRRHSIYFLTYSFHFRAGSCLKSSLFFPFSFICFLVSVLTVLSFSKGKIFFFHVFICDSTKSKFYEIMFSKNDLRMIPLLNWFKPGSWVPFVFFYAASMNSFLWESHIFFSCIPLASN